MPTNNTPGSFGSNRNRKNITNNDNRIRNIERNHNAESRLNVPANITPERWVDIICGSVIGIFLIAVLCTWSSFSELLFQNILFPVIYVGSKILALISVVGAGIGALCLKFRRRRRYW